MAAVIEEGFPPPAFEGFPGDALAFFEALAVNQDRDWFTANRARYEAGVVAPLRSLIADVSNRLAQESVPLRGDPARAIFRIHRDVRFSKNKAPYQTHAGAVLTRDGGKHATGVLYIHLDPAGSFAATGFYHPEPAALQAMRVWLADNPARWLALEADLAGHGLALSREEALKRAPRGFETAPSEIADALKLKNWVVRRDLSRAALGKPSLVDRLVALALETESLLRFGWSALDRQGDKAGAFSP